MGLVKDKRGINKYDLGLKNTRLVNRIKELVLEIYGKDINDIDFLLINREGYYVAGNTFIDTYNWLLDSFNETELRYLIMELEGRENLNYFKNKNLLMIYVDYEYDFKFDGEDF